MPDSGFADFGEESKAAYEQARRMQTEQDAAFPFESAVEIESRVWSRFENIEYGGPFSEVVLIALGWSAVVIRQSHLVFKNYSSEMQDTLVANTRVAYEHAIFVALISDRDFNPKTLERLDYQAFINWQSIFSTEVDDDSNLFSKLIDSMPSEIVPTRTSENEWLAKFEQVCNRFEESEHLYAQYRILSGFLHPGFQSGQSYISKVMMDETTSTNLSPDILPGSMILSFSLTNIAWTLTALDLILNSSEFGDLVQEIRALFDFDIELRLKDNN